MSAFQQAGANVNQPAAPFGEGVVEDDPEAPPVDEDAAE